MSAHPLQQRPPGFTYRDKKTRQEGSHRELHADAVSLARLAERFGTPLYVYSETTIRERYRQFEKAFRGCKHTICYSVKANSNLSILRVLARMGAGFDIVSGGELQRVVKAAAKSPALAERRLERGTRTKSRSLDSPSLRSGSLGMTERGTHGKAIVFSGVGKLAEEIDQALAAGILLFNVESASELKLLAARSAHLRKKARFAIRVNPDVAAKRIRTFRLACTSTSSAFPGAMLPELYRWGAKESFLEPRGRQCTYRLADHGGRPFSRGDGAHRRRWCSRCAAAASTFATSTPAADWESSTIAASLRLLQSRRALRQSRNAAAEGAGRALAAGAGARDRRARGSADYAGGLSQAE